LARCIYWWIVIKCQVINISAISWQDQVTFWWDDDNICFVLDQNIIFLWCWNKFTCGYFAPLWLGLSLYCLMLRGMVEATSTNFIVFCMTWPVFFLFLLAIVLSVLWFMTPYYPFGIFKLFCTLNFSLAVYIVQDNIR